MAGCAVGGLVQVWSASVSRERILIRACHGERAGGWCAGGSGGLRKWATNARSQSSQKGFTRTSMPGEHKKRYVKNDCPEEEDSEQGHRGTIPERNER